MILYLKFQVKDYLRKKMLRNQMEHNKKEENLDYLETKKDLKLDID